MIEKTLISSLMIEPKAVSTVSRIVHPDMFSDETCKKAFAAMLACKVEHLEPNMVNIQLKSGIKVSELNALAMYPSTPNTELVAERLVKDFRVRVESNYALNVQAILSQEYENPEDVLSQIQTAEHDKVAKLALTVTGDKKTMEERQDEWMKLLLDSIGKAGIKGISSGFADLDEMSGGWGPGHLIVIGARPSVGKALSMDTPFIMADGTQKLNRVIRVGDKLASVDGKENIVEGVFFQGDRMCYDVTLSDGRVVRVDGEHLWKVESSRFKEAKVLTTLDIASKLKMTRYKGRMNVVPHSGSFGNDRGIGMSPWLLGFLIGDGCLTGSGVQFSNPEQYIFDRVTDESGVSPVELRPTTDDSDYYIPIGAGKVSGLKSALTFHGVYGKLAHEKSVPLAVFTAIKEIRMGVLCGLLESDGWVEKSGSMQFSSSSKKLTLGVQRLVWSLGGHARYRLRDDVTYTYKGSKLAGKDAHLLTIVGDFDIRSPRLLKNMKPRKRGIHASIVSVEPVGVEPVQCIKVSHPSELFLCGEYVVTHNTQWLLHQAQMAARQGIKPGIGSVETSFGGIWNRLAGHQANLDTKLIRDSNLSEHELELIIKAHGTLKNKGYQITDRIGRWPQLEMELADMVLSNGVGMLFIDYLQLISWGRYKDKRIEIGEIAKACKNLGMRLEVPVMLLSQLVRLRGKFPTMDDLRETGDIEAHADGIILLHQDSAIQRNEVYVDVVKMRDGSIDRLVKQVNRATGRWGNQDDSTIGFNPHVPIKDQDFDVKAKADDKSDIPF